MFDPSSLFNLATGGLFDAMKQREKNDHEIQMLREDAALKERAQRIAKDGYEAVEAQDYEKSQELFVLNIDTGGWFGGVTLYMRGPNKVLCDSDGNTIRGTDGPIFCDVERNKRQAIQLVKDYGVSGLKYHVDMS
jgi:hypothetical protein